MLPSLRKGPGSSTLALQTLSSWRLPGAIPALSHSSVFVVAPAVSQAPNSRLGSADRILLPDVVRLGTILVLSSRQIEEGRRAASREVNVTRLNAHKWIEDPRSSKNVVETYTNRTRSPASGPTLKDLDSNRPTCTQTML